MVSFYTLITASLLLISAKLQDIIGKRKIFLIGIIIYAVGDLTATLSPNATVLFIGWSFLEGIGSALMAAGIVVLLAFAFFELRYSKAGKVALFDLRLLKDRNLRNGTLVRLFTAFAMAGMLFSLSVLSVFSISDAPYHTRDDSKVC